jgi:predicted TIM-barrel fold metal-dependent hydrolase
MDVPRGACDCHVHVFGPAARYPLAPDRAYTPPEASIEDLLSTQDRLGMQRMVVVQPSVYGADNSCMLDALKALGSRARGVAVVDEFSPLEDLHAAGVRGVRVNLQTGNLRDPQLVAKAAARVGMLGWHVQTFTRIANLKDLKPLPTTLVIDHFGLPRDQSDCEYLVRLIRTQDVYVKLSSPQRLPMDAGPLVQALVAAAPERCVWGSDWPHPVSGASNPKALQPFDEVDDVAALERLREWIPDEKVLRKVLVDNPVRLYEF